MFHLWNISEENMLKHGILGLLNYSSMNGYQIMTVFRDSLSFFWQAQTSQIYRELQMLEEHGWISSKRMEKENKHDSNMLFITEAGRKELLRWLKEDNPKNIVRSPLLMKTFFRGECSIDDNIDFFKKLPQQQAVFNSNTDDIYSLNNAYTKNINEPLKALYWKFTIDFGVMYEKMLFQWCRNCISELEKIKESDSKGDK